MPGSPPAAPNQPTASAWVGSLATSTVEAIAGDATILVPDDVAASGELIVAWRS